MLVSRPFKAETIEIAAAVSVIFMLLIYESVGPVIVYPVTLALGLILVRLTLQTETALRGFLRVYCCGVCAAAIAGFYAEVLTDFSQLHSDAAGFHELSLESSRHRLSMHEFGTHEGPLAIVIWGIWYEAWNFIGTERYIGVAMNCALIGLAAALATSITSLIRPNSVEAAQYTYRLLSWCGLVWLAAGIHLRDAAVATGVLVLVHVWAKVLAQPSRLLNWIWCALASFIFLELADYLRRGLSSFVFVASSICVLLLASRPWTKSFRPYHYRWTTVAGIIVAIVSLEYLGSNFSELLLHHREGYQELRDATSPSSPLTTSLLTSPSMSVRLLWGLAHLIYFPVPVWTYIWDYPNWAYGLFKTLSLPFLWLVIPASIAYFGTKRARSIDSMGVALMVIVISAIFFAATALSSIETRHTLPAVILISIPASLALTDLAYTRRAFGRLALGSLLAAALLHAIWFFRR
jgi:hypothetical protein